MEKTPLTGLARLKAAWINSMNGLRDIWRSEEAFRLEVILFFASIPVALWIAETMFHATVLCGAILFVLIIEVLNTAVEVVIDRIGEERHELSRIAKDLGSLAVLLSAILAGMVWLAALADYVLG